MPATTTARHSRRARWTIARHVADFVYRFQFPGMHNTMWESK